MLKQLFLSVLIGLSSLASDVSSAYANDYLCKIERIDTSRSSLAEFYQSFIGKEFSVERASGIMAGALKNNYVLPPEVVDLGSNENSYKVIASLKQGQGAGPGSNVYLLTINEYETSAKKPFLFAQNDIVYFGYCTHF